MRGVFSVHKVEAGTNATKQPVHYLYFISIKNKLSKYTNKLGHNKYEDISSSGLFLIWFAR